MKKLSKTEAELKKNVAYQKECVFRCLLGSFFLAITNLRKSEAHLLIRCSVNDNLKR